MRRGASVPPSFCRLRLCQVASEIDSEKCKADESSCTSNHVNDSGTAALALGEGVGPATFTASPRGDGGGLLAWMFFALRELAPQLKEVRWQLRDSMLAHPPSFMLCGQAGSSSACLPPPPEALAVCDLSFVPAEHSAFLRVVIAINGHDIGAALGNARSAGASTAAGAGNSFPCLASCARSVLSPQLSIEQARAVLQIAWVDYAVVSLG